MLTPDSYQHPKLDERIRRIAEFLKATHERPVELAEQPTEEPIELRGAFLAMARAVEQQPLVIAAAEMLAKHFGVLSDRIAERRIPQQSAIAARYKSLSRDDDFTNLAALENPRGEGWRILAEAMGVTVEQLLADPHVRRVIEVAAASNGQPAIFSEAEARSLLSELASELLEPPRT